MWFLSFICSLLPDYYDYLSNGFFVSFSPPPSIGFFQDGRSPMSSGAESDDSSGPDSPSVVVMPIRSKALATQQQLTRASIMEPTGLQGLVMEKPQHHHANGNTSSNSATATGGGGPAVSIRMSGSGKAQANNSETASASAINLAGIVGTLSRLDGLVSDIPSGLYPPTAFQHIPPEIVMQLVEMGHLKVHSNEGKLGLGA